jgi:hypothetical protein
MNGESKRRKVRLVTRKADGTKDENEDEDD